MKLSARLKYAFYIMKHPFDGFWCLKSEGIGTTASALTLLALFFVTLVIRLYTTSYIVSTIDLIDFSIWMLFLVVIGVFLLFCISNWCVTSLFSGSGSFKQIAISVAYCLTPVTLINIPLAIVSQFITQEEVAFYSFFNIFSIIYCVFLLFASNMTIHEYTMTKTIGMAFLTIFAMACVVIIAVLFVNLVQQVWGLFVSVYKEIVFRM